MIELTGEKIITEAEYFIDSNCEGIGNPMTSVDGVFDQRIESIVSDVDTTSLSLGQHTLYIRVKDSEDKWGVCRGKQVEIREPAYLTGAEFFFGTDPGPSYGESVNCIDGNCDDSIENFYYDFRPWCQTTGNHTLYMRACDSYLRWGDPESIPIDIIDSPINACSSDFDIDNDTDGVDLIEFVSFFTNSNCSQNYICKGDLNCDSIVNSSDLNDFAQIFGRNDCP
jgi:hypothetical protein